MPSEYQNETLQAALIAGGYDEKAAKVAAVAASRGLGAETIVNLISGIDGAAARIAEQIFEDKGQQGSGPAQMTEEQAKKYWENDLREAVGFPTSAGGEE
jgi:hypothetical protein